MSVVMPVRGEGSRVERSVRAVLAQQFPDDFEVIVVVGDSGDETRALVERIARDDARVRIVENPDGRTPVALNLGVDAAHGELVARIDGHAYVAPDFLASSVEVLRRTGAEGVGGVARHVGEGPVGRAIALAMTSPLGSGNARFRIGSEEMEADTVVFPLYRREVFERVGRYDETLTRNQDDEFNHRLRLAGARIVTSPAIRSEYLVRSSLPALWRQYADYGWFRVATIVKHGRPGAIRQLAPPALVMGLATCAAAQLVPGAPRRLGRAVVAAYGAAVVAGGHVVAARADQPARGPLVAVATATMHLAYGTGFWAAVAGRLPRRRAR